MSNFNRTCQHCVEADRVRRFAEKVQAGELTRLRKIEAAAREVIAGEMPHECWHEELREALGEAP